MSILVDKDTRLLVQGITGNEGTFHARAMLAYGTNVVGGVTPGRGGQMAVDGKVPVFNTVSEAVEATGANASIIYVPAPLNATDAIIEAAEAGIELIVCISEGVPANDMVAAYAVRARAWRAADRPELPRPASPPARPRSASCPATSPRPARSAWSRARGTLTYEAVDALTRRAWARSTLRRHRRRPDHRHRFIDVLALFQDDPETEGIVLIGEIGGTDEEDAAALHQGARDQAGRRLHRRADRAAGQAHGPRRRDHLGRRGHRAGEDRRARGGGRQGRSAANRHRAVGERKPGVARFQS